MFGFALSLATALVSGVLANELLISGTARRLVVHGPEETLRHYCHADSEGRMWLELPGGARFELVTSIDDPVIVNRGDGAFHPFDEHEVASALASVSYPLAPITGDVFLLPFPRRHGLESAAGPGIVLLSPGVRPLTPEHQHAEFVHELGHLVQYTLMPDSNVDGWIAYRRLRGIEDAGTYGPASVHADRPHEIFAEDFRALFGGRFATYSGSIENATLTPPARVAGLDRFMRELASRWAPPHELTVSPSPSRGPLQFSAAGAAMQPLDLHDVAGRRLATLEPVAVQGGVQWTWDGGRLAGGGPCVVFARVRGSSHLATRVTLLP